MIHWTENWECTHEKTLDDFWGQCWTHFTAFLNGNWTAGNCCSNSWIKCPNIPCFFKSSRIKSGSMEEGWSNPGGDRSSPEEGRWNDVGWLLPLTSWSRTQHWTAAGGDCDWTNDSVGGDDGDLAKNIPDPGSSMIGWENWDERLGKRFGFIGGFGEGASFCSKFSNSFTWDKRFR